MTASRTPPARRQHAATRRDAMAPLRYARVSPRRVVCAPSAVRLADVSHVELGTRCFGGGNTGPPPERVPLSPLDTFLFVRLLTIPVAFFYASRVDEATLVESLAKTLARFPLVAGRLRPAVRKSAAPTAAAPGGASSAATAATTAVAGDFDVICNNEGVLFDVFTCDGTLADFDGYADWSVVGKHTQPIDNNTPPRFCGKLEPSAIVAGKAPFARFRLTHLKDGGSIVGISFSHMIVDGVAALSFCGTWSNEHEALLASRTPGPPPYGEPCFDRKIFFTAATSMPADLPEEVRANGSAAHAKVVKLLDAATPGKVAHRVAKMATDVLLRKNATFTVRVTAAQVARARAAGASLTGASLSANDVALGLAWALLRRARKRGVDGPPRLGDDEHFLLQTIDLRRYLPGLPQAYFGNCAWALQVAAPVTARSPLELAAGCRASLASFTNSTAVFDQAALMLRATGGQSTSAQLRTTLLPAFGDGMVSSWHAPVIWNFTFGAGKPRWFCGSIYPVAPWGFCIVAGRPDAVPRGEAPDYLLCGTCPAASVNAMLADAQRLIAEVAGPDPALATTTEAAASTGTAVKVLQAPSEEAAAGPSVASAA